MLNNTLVILGSARKQSDTAKLVDYLFKDMEVTVVDLLDYKISPYSYDEDYPAEDQFPELARLMLDYQNLVFATPVYWYAMSGHMKIFFDRLTDLVTTAKSVGRQMRGKRVFLVVAGAEDALSEGFGVPFRLTADYFEMNFVSTIYHKTGQPYVNDKQQAAFLKLIAGSKQTNQNET